MWDGRYSPSKISLAAKTGRPWKLPAIKEVLESLNFLYPSLFLSGITVVTYLTTLIKICKGWYTGHSHRCLFSTYTSNLYVPPSPSIPLLSCASGFSLDCNIIYHDMYIPVCFYIEHFSCPGAASMVLLGCLTSHHVGVPHGGYPSYGLWFLPDYILWFPLVVFSLLIAWMVGSLCCSKVSRGCKNQTYLW